MLERLQARFRDAEGATAVEYGIMVALIAIVIIASVFFVGQALDRRFDCVGTAIDEAPADGLPEDCAPGETDGTD